MNHIKKEKYAMGKFFMMLSIVLLFSSCASEQTEQENTEEFYTIIPVSSAFDLDLLVDLGAPWIARMANTGEAIGIRADNVFQAEDGTGMLYATVSFGSGFVCTRIEGYNPVSGTIYTLWERFAYDYRFLMYENELFVAKYQVNPFSGRTGIFRPMLNHENLSFDLVEVDDELSALIKQQVS